MCGAYVYAQTDFCTLRICCGGKIYSRLLVIFSRYLVQISSPTRFQRARKHFDFINWFGARTTTTSRRVFVIVRRVGHRG